MISLFFFFQAEDGIRDHCVTGVQTCALPICWQRPTPSVTQIVWPNGCVCQAVRAPGVKCTLAAAARAGGSGVAMVSMNTAPVNQSLGPGFVSSELRVICMWLLLVASVSGAVRYENRFATTK